MRYTGIDVVLPVHDEEALLAPCLRALAECAAVTPLPVTLTVVLDACTDGSALVSALNAAGIPAVCIGSACGTGLADSGGAPIDPPGADEIYRIALVE